MRSRLRLAAAPLAAPLVVAAVVAAALTDARPAVACGACTTTFSSIGTPYRSDELRANARFFVGGGMPEGATGPFDPATIRLRRAVDDCDVPFTIEPTGAADGSVFVVPTEALPPFEDVVLTTSLGATTYRAGTGVDAIAPATPHVVVTGGFLGEACCANTGARLTATGGIDDDGAPAATLHVALDSPAGARVVVFGYQPNGGEGLGTSAEGCVATDPLAVDGEVVTAMVTVVDWAGNASAPAGPFTFTYAAGEQTGGCMTGSPLDGAGCAAAGDGTAVIGASALVVVAAARRRRRRPS